MNIKTTIIIIKTAIIKLNCLLLKHFLQHTAQFMSTSFWTDPKSMHHLIGTFKMYLDVPRHNLRRKAPSMIQFEELGS